MTRALPFPLNRRLDAIVPYKPGKPVGELERELGIRDSVKLASNENPLGPSPLAVRAMQATLEGAHRYPDGGAYYLKERLAREAGFPPECIIVGNGSTEIVEMLAKAFLPPEGESLVSEGAFIMYRIASLAASAAVRSVPMTHDLKHDVAAMAAAVAPSTHLVFIANPNNPTGTRISRTEMDEYFRRVPGTVLTVVDEAYREYLDDPEYPDASEILRRGGRVMVLRTFSKIHGLAGARIGYGMAVPEVVAALEKVRSPFNTNSIAQAGALAALDDVEHVRNSRRINQEQRSRLESAFRERGIPFTPSSTNFLFASLGRSGKETFQALLPRGIIVRPLDVYGFHAHVRITVGTATENDRLLASIDRIRAEWGFARA
ncbi:MAG: histidinol-phosphate transaminase [Acidobacteriota bacterium]